MWAWVNDGQVCVTVPAPYILVGLYIGRMIQLQEIAVVCLSVWCLVLIELCPTVVLSYHPTQLGRIEKGLGRQIANSYLINYWEAFYSADPPDY